MMYLRGKHPFIKLKVELDQKRWVDLDCLVDTGFSGGLAIPEHYQTSFPASKFIEAQFVLADGSTVSVNTTITMVKFNTHEKEVAVVFMGNSDSLVGVEFLDQMRFCLDLISYRAELTGKHK